MEMCSSTACMDAPLLQEMATDLEALPAVVIRQQSQWAEVIAQGFGVPYEALNKYKVSALEGQPAGSWHPTGEELELLPELLRIEESSSVWARAALACLGCLNLRPLTLHFTERGVERVSAERPFRLGGCCGCPLESTVRQQGAVLGQTLEDFRCVDNCCKCVFYTKVLEQAAAGHPLDHKYTLKSWLCCCGRSNNCCGATCCNQELLIDVLDPEGNLVATVRKVYAPTADCSACCRCSSMFSNYILEFPKEATAAQRALLMAALLHVDYQLFERKGGNNGGS